MLFRSDLEGTFASEDVADQMVFRATSDDYAIARKSRMQIQNAASVATADIVTFVLPDDRHLGVIQFDVVPNADADLSIQVPDESCQLIQCRVANSVVPLQADAQGWRLPLVSDTLPQRIEVLFQTTPSSGRRVSAPVLTSDGETIPVQRTLWTNVVTDGDEDSLEKVAQAWAMDVERFERMIEMLDDVASDASNEALGQWYLRWSSRLDQLHQRINEQYFQAAQADIVLDGWQAELRNVDRERARFSRRIQQLDTSEPFEAAADIASTVANLSSGVAIQRAVFDGWHPAIVAQSTGQSGQLISRLIAATFCLALAFVIPAWMKRKRIDRPSGEVLSVAVLAVGLASWLWLAPSILGLILLFAFAIVTLMPGRLTAA